MHHKRKKKSINKSAKKTTSNNNSQQNKKKNAKIIKNKKSNQSKVKRKSLSSTKTKNGPKIKSKPAITNRLSKELASLLATSTSSSMIPSTMIRPTSMRTQSPIKPSLPKLKDSKQKKSNTKNESNAKSTTITHNNVARKTTKKLANVTISLNTNKNSTKQKIKNTESTLTTSKKNAKTSSTMKNKENVATKTTSTKKTIPTKPKSNNKRIVNKRKNLAAIKSSITTPTKQSKSKPGKIANNLVIKKSITIAKQKQSKISKKRRKSGGHRVASLNASAKVKLLSENDQNNAIIMTGQKKLEPPFTSIKSDDDDDDDVDQNRLNVIDFKPSSSKKVKINAKSGAKPKSNTASSTVVVYKKETPKAASSPVSKLKNRKHLTNKIDKKLIKQKSTSGKSCNKNEKVNQIKTKTTAVVTKKKLTNNRKKKKKKKTIDPDIEIIDTRRNKRMASLNASAMMAATFSPEKERRLVLASAKPLLKSSSSDPHHNNNHQTSSNPNSPHLWSTTTHHSSTVEEHIEMTTVKTTVKLRHDNTTVVETTTTTQQRIEQQKNLLNQSSNKKRKNESTINKRPSTSKKRKTAKNNQMIDATSAQLSSNTIATPSSCSHPSSPVTITTTSLSPTISAFTPCPSGSSTPLIIPTVTHPPPHSQALDLIYQVPSHSHHHLTTSQSLPVTSSTCINSTNIDANSLMMANKKKSRSKKKQKSPHIQSTTATAQTSPTINQPSNSSIMKKYYRKIETRTVEHQSSEAAAIAKVTTATTSNIIQQHNPRTNFYHPNTNAIVPPNGMMTFSSLPPYNAIVGGNYINPSFIKPYNQHTATTTTLIPTTGNQTFGSNHSHATPYPYPFPLSQPYSLYNPATVSTVPFQLIPFGNANNSGHVFEQPTPITGSHPFISPQPFIAASPPTIYPYINSPFTPAATPIPAIGQFFHLPTAMHQPTTASPFLGVHYLAGSNPIGVAVPPRYPAQSPSCHYSHPSSTSNQSYLNVFTGSGYTPPSSSSSSSSSLSSNITNNQSDRIIYPVSFHPHSGRISSSSSTSTSSTVDTATSMNITRPSIVTHHSQPQIINFNGTTNNVSMPSALNPISNVLPYGLFRPQSSSNISIPVSTSSSSAAPISSSIRPSALNFLNSNFIPSQQQTPTFFVQTRIQPPDLSSLQSTLTINSLKKKPTMMKSASKTLKNSKNNQRRNGVVDNDLLKQISVDNENGNGSDGGEICHTGNSVLNKKRNKQLLIVNCEKNSSNNGKSKRKTNTIANSDHTLPNGFNETLIAAAGGKKSKSNLTNESNGKNLLLENGIGTTTNTTVASYSKKRNNLLLTTSVLANNSKNNNNNDKVIDESNENVSPSTTTNNCEFRCVMNKRTNRRPIIHGWSWEGEPIEKYIFINNDEQSYRRKCYPAIKHNEGETIRPGDCVLLKSGPRKTDLPFVAKITSLWESPEKEMMMSLLWYYRPEHTEIQDIQFISGEIYASRHRDANSVACIDDKCFVLTYNEYCRYKRQKCRQLQSLAFLQPDLTAMIVPNGEPWSGDENQPTNDQYQQQQIKRSQRVGDNNHLPPLNTLPELVFCCRKVYDFRQKRILKNPSYESRYKSSA
ncbi:uncharacterized protein LOC113797865 [Dermatophagoides pteronyssinus]|uniref:uncharacterized protein LOC113797865 n=1 Tax=Dermatophagoides pteronyssinus TaxID=6956 RepID=UPI003F67F2F7